jgi:HlyD family secretion protein
MVTAGQPLIRLSNSNLQLQLINSEAQLTEQLDRLTSTKLQFQQSGLTRTRELIDASYQTQQAEQRLARLVALTNSGIVKRAELEDEQLEVERLKRIQTEVARAKQQHESLHGQEIRQLDQSVSSLNRYLEVARQNLSRLVIAAPFDGQLTVLNAHVGESKQPGQRIGQVDRIDTFKVTAQIDEHYLPRVSVGQTASAQIDGKQYAFEIAKVYPEVRDRQFKADLNVPSGIASSLRRGQSLQLRLQLGGARASLTVANGAFYDDSGGAWAFVLPPEGTTAERRPVKLGRRNPEQVEVLAGLSPGERVIVSSYESFKGAERVELTGN